MTVFVVDPFTDVYNAIWAALEASSDFTTNVPLNARVDLADSQPRFLGVPMLGHKPRVRIEPAGGATQLFATSQSATLIQNYRLELMTGDDRVDVYFFPTKWYILKALATAGVNLGLPFVIALENVDYDEVRDGELQAGWFGVITLSVKMSIPTSDFTA